MKRGLSSPISPSLRFAGNPLAMKASGEAPEPTPGCEPVASASGWAPACPAQALPFRLSLQWKHGEELHCGSPLRGTGFYAGESESPWK